MKFLAVCLGILTILTMTACRKSFAVFVSQLSNGEVYFQLEPDVNTKGKGTEIRNLEVYRVISRDKPRVMVWAISTKSGKPEKVNTIMYGMTPPGFKEDAPAEKLAVGQLYEVIGGMPGKVGGADFKAERTQ